MRRVLLLLIAISVSKTAVVKWMPNKSFNLAINFKDHTLPCSKQSVVFPETIYETVRVDSAISVSGLVLPRNGELIFEDGTIIIGTDSKDNCTKDGNAEYLPKSQSYWAQPDVWSSPRFNEATPDAERIPCYDDEVEFPTESQFTVFLPQRTQYIRKLDIGHMPFSTVMFYLIVKHVSSLSFTPWQQYVLNENGETGVVVEEKSCQSVAGCLCQKNMLDVDCTAKFCSVPKCLNPIQPVGHCCRICGGYLLLDIDESFNMLALSEDVAETVQSYGKESIAYHIGRILNNKVQVVVVDKGEYVGTSAEVINEIDYRIGKRGFQSVAQISGGPVSEAGLGGKIAVSMFFVVVFVMGAIYVYYYRLPNLPEVRIPSFGRSNRGILSRFNRRTDSVVSLTRRDSTVTLRSAGGTAFRNPLYDSKRGRVEVAESVVEERLEE